ncbi:MAG: Hpt domain-containing protein [Polyangiaceae bacterium]|nr:Hpt domain-containing protein [Polyangiaceae bacterium]
MSADELHRRAVAAEKTVEVLKRKVVELYNGDTSSMHRQVEAAKRREAENKKKRELAEVRAKELARYSETLEAEVARRTEAIKTILDNVTFGFLVVNRELVVQPETTRSCVALFDEREIEGRPLTELLKLGPRAAEHLLLSSDQVFEDLLPEEVSLAQMPQKFPLPDGRILRAEGSVIRDKDGAVSAMLFTISDISALEEATRESNNNRTLVGILRQKESFQAFLVETQQHLRSARDAVDDQPLVRRVVHTVKGNGASYGLVELVELTHAIEEKPAIEAADIDDISDALRLFLARNRGVLEIDYEKIGDHGYQVSADQMSQFRGIVAKMGGGSPELRHWTARVLAKPAAHLLGPIEDFTSRLAERLGKEVDFAIDGGDTIVDVEAMRPVLMSLSHLIRNAVDHGVEPPHARAPKPHAGRVRLRVRDDANSYVVEVEDDGAGVDLPRVAARAIERGFATREVIDSMPDRGLSLIFVDGLSTAEITTNISGRGIGMSAVKSAVDAADGKMEIRTQRGLGTTFTMSIPKPDIALGGAE